MAASYTVESLDVIAYGVVQIDPSAPGLTLPAPSQVPEVAADKIPDAHDGRTSPGGGYKILIRHIDEDDPLPDAGIDWIDHTDIRSHIDDNSDVWDAV